MGNICSVSCDELVPQIMHFLCGKAEYLYNLEENLEALQKETQDLNAMRNDVLRRLSKEEDRGLQGLQQVKSWVSMAEEIKQEASRLLDESIYETRRLSTYGYCSNIPASTYHYIEKVAMTLKQVETLRTKGVFEDVVDRALPPLVKKKAPVQPTVSQEKLLERAWGSLQDGSVGILGIYGLGGVGKTTLLTQIKDKFLEAGDVYLVMFVDVASKEVESIQEEISKRLGLLDGEDWGQKTEREKASVINQVLNRNSFVLLLDDIPRKVDLHEIGVSRWTLGRRSKVVFTTRPRQVCTSMSADDEVEVECLSAEDAWDLFQSKLGRNTLTSHPEIPKLARVFVSACRGFPLALHLLGEAMSCKRTVPEWRYAIHVLASSVAEFSDMEEDEFLPVLKPTYDNMSGENMRSCFLYCALFQEYRQITKQDLVHYWVCEGMVSDENKGHEMIGDLVRMGFLMENKSGYGVEMHDVLCEMALWIASDFGRSQENFVVKGGERIREMPDVKEWNMVTKMSVISTEIEKINGSIDCPQLTTLFLQENKNLKCISGDFFRWMKSLLVLDLSLNRGLSVLPEEVSSLVSLRFLNLSWTLIKRLPLGLKELKHLIHLDLEHTLELQGIDVIPSLLSLQVLRLFRSVPMDLGLMDDVQLLNSLKEFSVTVTQDAFFQRLLSIHRLTSCIQRLGLINITIFDEEISLVNLMSSIRELDFKECYIEEITIDWTSSTMMILGESAVRSANVEEIQKFIHLRKVSLVACNGLKDLTWLLCAPCLGDLVLRGCIHMENIISREKAMCLSSMSEQPFGNLNSLSLSVLPQLESIYWDPLPFPALERIRISRCPKLRKVPFNSGSAKGILVQTDLDQEWIEVVGWEDDATKHLFSHLNTRNFTRHFGVSRRLTRSEPDAIADNRRKKAEQSYRNL